MKCGNTVSNAGLDFIRVHHMTVTYNYIHDCGVNTNNDHGIYWSSTTGPGNLVANNLLVRNAARGLSMHDNGGIGIWDVIVAHNTIVGNGGTGILVRDGDRRTIVNNLCAFNAAAVGGQGQIYTFTQGTDSPASNDKYWNNLTWSTIAGKEDIQNDVVPPCEELGNIIANPLFINDLTDFHLQAGSPAIGLGRIGYATNDYDQKLRDALPDAGAYEF